MNFFFFGTTAEYIKLWPVLNDLKTFKLVQVFNTQQHQMNFDLLSGLPIPFSIQNLHKNYSAKSNIPDFLLWSLRTFLATSWSLLKEKRNSQVIVHGDTATALIVGVCTKLLGRKLLHIEAGYRSGSIGNPFPEELIRIVLDRISDVSFCPSEDQMKNIKRKSRAINTFGNTGADSTWRLLGDDLGNLATTAFGIVTLHRSELILNEKLLMTFLTSINAVNPEYPMILYVGAFEKEKISRLLRNVGSSIQLVDKLTYDRFIRLVNNAPFVITDSGGLQQECNLIGIPCFIARENTEETVLRSNCTLIGNDGRKISDSISSYKEMRLNSLLPLNPSPSEIIRGYIFPETLSE
jgi:UDP-N-acetylglucosamine 2-epimerase (non-hydrolysing)